MKVLLADDDAVFRERLARALVARHHEVIQAADGSQALAAVGRCMVDAAILDLKMPGMSGLDVLRQLLHLHPRLPIVVLTGYASIASAMEAVRLGVRDYLVKPADVEKILAVFAAPAKAVAPSALPAPDVASLERVEWEHIQRVLADCGGNVSEAARQLGIHRRSLQRKLQKYPPKK